MGCFYACHRLTRSAPGMLLPVSWQLPRVYWILPSSCVEPVIWVVAALCKQKHPQICICHWVCPVPCTKLQALLYPHSHPQGTAP
jgi:hypothetical protein